MSIDTARATERLMRYLAIEGVTGQEQAIGRAVEADLLALGVPRPAVRFDTAHERIPLPTQTGNLIVHLPGTRSGPRLLFATHLDTVPLAAGARPMREGNRIRPAGATALGGDNRTGVACLVTLAATLLQQKLPHPPLTLLFTVREESGLFGARHLDPADLGDIPMGFNVDGNSASEFVIGAVGAERWEVTIRGRAAHAGVHPEEGISATAVAALAIADVVRDGWFGKVRRDGREGTSNVGSVSGEAGRSAGEATNVVTDFARVTGEARSHDPEFTSAIVAAYRDTFARAAEQLPNVKGQRARVEFHSRLDYYPFQLATDELALSRAESAAKRLGLPATRKMGRGGLDANWLVRHGIPTVTFGAGQNQIHTVEEFVDLDEFERGCRMAVTIAMEPD